MNKDMNEVKIELQYALEVGEDRELAHKALQEAIDNFRAFIANYRLPNKLKLYHFGSAIIWRDIEEKGIREQSWGE